MYSYNLIKLRKEHIKFFKIHKAIWKRFKNINKMSKEDIINMIKIYNENYVDYEQECSVLLNEITISVFQLERNYVHAIDEINGTKLLTDNDEYYENDEDDENVEDDNKNVNENKNMNENSDKVKNQTNEITQQDDIEDLLDMEDLISIDDSNFVSDYSDITSIEQHKSFYIYYSYAQKKSIKLDNEKLIPMQTFELYCNNPNTYFKPIHNQIFAEDQFNLFNENVITSIQNGMNCVNRLIECGINMKIARRDKKSQYSNALCLSMCMIGQIFGIKNIEIIKCNNRFKVTVDTTLDMKSLYINYVFRFKNTPDKCFVILNGDGREKDILKNSEEAARITEILCKQNIQIKNTKYYIIFVEKNRTFYSGIAENVDLNTIKRRYNVIKSYTIDLLRIITYVLENNSL